MADEKPIPKSPSAGEPSDAEVCRYIAETLVELRSLTRRPSLRMLGYMLDNVREEAEKLAKGKGR